jgi:hypothetical protein
MIEKADDRWNINIPYWISSVDLKKFCMVVAGMILIVLVGSPIAHILLNGVFGSNFDYGKAIFYGVSSIVSGSGLVAIILMGWKRFSFQHGD